jgi:putative membrane protein
VNDMTGNETKQTVGGPQQPEADSGHDYPMPAPRARTGEQFRTGVMGPATLSAAVSQIAVDKATRADTKQFANFELREAIAVTAILKGLNTPVPPMDSVGQALLDTLRLTPVGADFDKTYITAELANHEFLRDLADSYLANSTKNGNAEEKHTRDLATLAITSFKEHVVLSKNIVQAMGE